MPTVAHHAKLSLFSRLDGRIGSYNSPEWHLSIPQPLTFANVLCLRPKRHHSSKAKDFFLRRKKVLHSQQTWKPST